MPTMGDSETVYLHAVVNIVVAVIISIDKNAAVKVWSGIVTALGLVLTGGIVAAFSMVAAAVLIGVACFSLIQFRKLPQPENNTVKAITQRAECEEYNLDEKKKVFEETTELLRRERIAYDLNPDSLLVNWPDKKQISDAKDRIQYQNDVFHLAVCGVSGTGKSSLINALRGLTVDEANAAPIGTTETTTFALRYLDPRKTNLFSRFVWYDFPGAGTPTIPREDYFNKQGLFLFDFIIVVYNRFTEIDADILANCQCFGIPAFIVRSMSDQNISGLMDAVFAEEDQYKAYRDRYMAKTRSALRENLDQCRLSTKLPSYLVSARCVYDLFCGFGEAVSEQTDEKTLLTKRKKRGKQLHKSIDEVRFMKDILDIVKKRRYDPSSLDKANSKVLSGIQDMDTVFDSARTISSASNSSSSSGP